MSTERFRPIPEEVKKSFPPEVHQLKEHAVSQFELDFPMPINKTACGLANLVSAENYVLRTIHPKPETEIIDFINFDRRPNLFIYARFANRPEIEFPISPCREEQKDQEQLANTYKLLERLSRGTNQPDFEVYIREPTNSVYRPTFSVEYGTDARGTLEWLEQRGFQGALFEYNPKTDYTPPLEHHYIISDRGDFLNSFYTLTQGKDLAIANQTIPGDRRVGLMASIRQKELGHPLSIKHISDPNLPSTHQVLAIPHPIDKRVYFLDPAMTSSEQKVFSRTPKEFNQAFCPEDTARAHFIAVWK